MLALAALTVPGVPGVLGVLAAEVPDKAVCVVCASHGESKPEKVAASTTHEGVTYHFCATDCRDAFVADPAAYLPLPPNRDHAPLQCDPA